MTQLVVPRFEGEYRFLSNFYNSPITIMIPGKTEVIFDTAEHLFQALKYKAMNASDDDRFSYILQVTHRPDPNHAKKMGRKVKIDTAKWDAMKIEMMRQTVWEKFKQNPALVPLLLATDSAMLVEGNTWQDKFWGRCDGEGYNILGSIIMEVRGFYRWNGASAQWTTTTAGTMTTT